MNEVSRAEDAPVYTKKAREQAPIRKTPAFSWMSFILLTVLTLIWGSSFKLMKLGMLDEKGQELLQPQHVAGLRISLAFLTLLPFAIYHFRKIPGKRLLPVFCVGLFGNAIPAFLFTASEARGGISGSLAGMLNATTPIFAVIIGLLVFGMRLSRVNYLGVMIGFVGVTGLMLARGADSFSSEAVYIFMVLTATFCYAISVNFIRQYLGGINPVAIASVSFMFIGVPVTGWVLSQGVISEISASPAHTGAFGYTAILAVAGTALAVVLFNYLVQITNAVYASTVTYLMPIVAIVWGVLSNEFFTWWYVLFIAVILLGVNLTNKK